MASDVEVLRWLAKISAVVADVVGRPNDEVDRALSSALATLEAREAQPKVEGRMDDEKLALERHLRESSSIMPARAAAQAFLDAECDRARASERAWEAKWLQERMEHKKTREALSKRVEELERALEPHDESCTENPSCDAVRPKPGCLHPHRHFKDGRWLDDGSEM